ncbi:MAG: hypothetical protein Tsb009_09080 [Planctomycetaceae bacterium]
MFREFMSSRFFSHSSALVALIASIAILSSDEQAQARGIILITHGETVKHVADLPEEMSERLFQRMKKNYAVGYRYNAFGIFWLDLWTWGGDHCIYFEDEELGLQVTDINDAQFEQLAGKPKHQFPRPWFYIVPPGLLVIGGLILVALPFALKAHTERKMRAEKYKDLIADKRYAKALEIALGENDSGDPEQGQSPPAHAAIDESNKTESAEDARESTKPDPFTEAVQYLVDHDVSRKDAEENLIFMLGYLADQELSAGK